jgi:hypothetical protein
MTAIRYIAHIPRPKRSILIDAQYADNGHATFEQYAEMVDETAVDHAALAELLDGAVWVGEGSPWQLPEHWATQINIWVTGERSFDATPLGNNKALAFTITNELPWYPTAETIRDHLHGKQLATLGARGDVTHADVLVAVAAGRTWRP